MQMPKRDLVDSVWMQNEIARLRDALATLEHRNTCLVIEVQTLRRELFAERAANLVVNGVVQVFADALTTDAVVA